MEYQPRRRTPRNFKKYETAKTRTAAVQRHRSNNRYPVEKRLSPSEEIVEKTLRSLRNLGRQIFGLPPFNEHFDRWLLNLKGVLSEFKSNPAISVDERFIKESSQVLANIESYRKMKSDEENSHTQTLKSLLNTRVLLTQIEEEYSSNLKKIKYRWNSEVKLLINKVDGLKEELNHLTQTKRGVLKVFTKKTSRQQVEETRQRLTSTQQELQVVKAKRITEQEMLRDDYVKKKQPIVEKIRKYQEEISHVDVDYSSSIRRETCETLRHAVNTLLQRSNLIRSP